MTARVDRAARRRLLAAGGAIVVSFPLRAAPLARTSAASAPVAQLPGSLKSEPFIDGWIRIDALGGITVFTGKAELGQGIKTALIQVAAEQLLVDPRRVAIVAADTERTPDEGYTAGSHSMQDSGTAIRLAAAQTRAILASRAAMRFGVGVEDVLLRDGVASAGVHRAGYGELVTGEVLHVRARADAPLRDPRSHFVSGKAWSRIDIPAKVSGAAAYVQDLRLEGMVHGRVLRPAGPNATLGSFDASAIAALPGVLKVVQDGRFVGVVAQREWQAVVAWRRMTQIARWDETPSLPLPGTLYRSLREAPSEDSVIAERGTPPLDATTSISAAYRRPYQAHASIGPSCAVARVAGNTCTVWSHTQGVFPLRKAIAELLRLPAEQVRCIHVEGSGCYGHNGADDVAADAALLARAWPGRPVRVQWMREDEHAWEPYGPPMIAELRATLDASGAIVDWAHDVWSNPHSTRPGGAGDLLAGTLVADAFVPTLPKPLPQPEGGGDRNAIPLYAFPSLRITHHFLPRMPLRTSALRSLGAYHNVFAIESFMDELARAGKVDPIDFRLRHMRDPRAQAVIGLAAERFGWTAWRPRAGRGRGFAFARYKNLAAYAAIAMEVEVRRDSGAVRVVRAVAATDSGEIVNPDGIRNQIEGGIVQATSWTLFEAVAFDATRVTSRDWGGYPILRFPQAPGSIDVHLVDRPGEPFLGTGEAAQGPAAAAIANGVADAVGVRLRDIPFTPARVREALAA
ncbi:MAG TPA: molybdopterin cofactor-binding domain-containing protein [Caldimonas sp.]|nr:molybdopterin cofactor-binding domain-containing protein [Caldimonas sp.]